MEDRHLPTYGVGPLFVAAILLATVASLVLDFFGLIPETTYGPAIVYQVVGTVLAAMWIPLWYCAVFRNRIGEGIEENRLVTSGIYAWVRNPIYSAFMFLAWGLIVFNANLYLFILIPTFWVLLTVMMQNTEEVWLRDLYGQEYIEYCEHVNRCIPWPPRRGDQD